MNPTTKTTPARQAAEQVMTLLSRSGYGSRENAIQAVAGAIHAAYEPERQKVREAIKAALSLIEPRQNTMDDEIIRNQLRDMLEGTGDK